MLDIKFVREQPQAVLDSARRRGVNVDVNKLLELDERRRVLTTETEQLRSQLKLAGKPSEQQLAELQQTKQAYEKAHRQLESLTETFNEQLAQLPNLIAADTPDGGEEANRVEAEWGTKPQLKKPKDHLALGEQHDLFDFTAGAKVAGNKFYFAKARFVKLWQAISRLALEEAEKQGFAAMLVPHLVNERVAAGTGYLPRGEEQQNYLDPHQKLVMIATSEIPLTGYYMDQVIDVAKPIRLAGVSPCYRLEAGAYGKYAKGLYRVHQFEKVELYSFAAADGSEAEQQAIVALEENIAQKLELPYRKVRNAVGDLAAAAYKKYDLEYYSPAEDQYRELTSCSNCTDYQARRLNIRYRGDDGSLHFAHTVNGTAVTSTRSVIALLENHQTDSGAVKIPAALQALYGADKL